MIRFHEIQEYKHSFDGFVVNTDGEPVYRIVVNVCKRDYELSYYPKYNNCVIFDQKDGTNITEYHIPNCDIYSRSELIDYITKQVLDYLLG